MKKINAVIFGATGSIGKSTLSIISKYQNLINLEGITCNSNLDKLIEIAKKYKVKKIGFNENSIKKEIKHNLNEFEIFNDLSNFNKIISKKTDIIIYAISGLVSLNLLLILLKSGKKIGIANKECIITLGQTFNLLSKKYNTEIIPLDSEHNSIYHLLRQDFGKHKSITITASGGPFVHFNQKRLQKVTLTEALKHPIWKMGKKISIDSSTLMNKILELVEAQKLFNISYNKLDILIHPESLVHAIIEFKNGLVKFMYHDTSMIIPLANAIFDGKINIENFYKNKKVKFKDKITKNLNFDKVNNDIFPLIKLKNKILEFPSSPIIINAANEILVDHFLNKKLQFLRINKIIMSVLNDRNYKKYAIRKPKNINHIIEIDKWARETAKKYVL